MNHEVDPGMLAEARRLAAEFGIDAAARTTENSHAFLSIGDLSGRRY